MVFIVDSPDLVGRSHGVRRRSSTGARAFFCNAIVVLLTCAAMGGAPACGGSTGTAPDTGAGGAAGANSGGAGAGGAACATPWSVTPLPPTDCPVVAGGPLGEAVHPLEGGGHVVICSSACYGTVPPSSGNHYPSWPAYKIYDQPVPWGFLVHGLEHGAVVVVYNCPCGCDDELAAAKAWIASLPRDTSCDAPPRVILAPDPTLDVPFAASAWEDAVGGWTLRAQSFDPAVFSAFFSAHYDRGPESICFDGADGSVSGWCN